MGRGRLRWDALAPFLLPARKVEIIEVLDFLGEPLSPTDLYHVLEMGDPSVTLQQVNHHMVGLAAAGILTVVDSSRVGRRNAQRKLYTLAREVTR